MNNDSDLMDSGIYLPCLLPNSDPESQERWTDEAFFQRVYTTLALALCGYPAETEVVFRAILSLLTASPEDAAGPVRIDRNGRVIRLARQGNYIASEVDRDPPLYWIRQDYVALKQPIGDETETILSNASIGPMLRDRRTSGGAAFAQAQ